MGAFNRLFARFRKSPTTDGRERRAHYRHNVDCLGVAMVGGRAITVQVENISACGAFVSPRIEAVKGSAFMFRIPEAGVSMQARIVRQGHDGTGLYFDDSASAERVVEMFAA